MPRRDDQRRGQRKTRNRHGVWYCITGFVTVLVLAWAGVLLAAHWELVTFHTETMGAHPTPRPAERQAEIQHPQTSATIPPTLQSAEFSPTQRVVVASSLTSHEDVGSPAAPARTFPPVPQRFMLRQPTPKPAPIQSLEAGQPQKAQASQIKVDTECVFKPHVDYVSEGSEEMLEGLTAEECCKACARRNAQRKGSCAVGVLSSGRDDPPSACWLKQIVRRAVRKEGVRACWPPGHGAIPPDPQGHGVGSSSSNAASSSSGNDFEGRSAALSVFNGPSPNKATTDGRANALRDAVRHAWSNYRNLAWGLDELKPVSGRGTDSSFHHAVTMVDSLDTLWLMGLKDEFNEARDWIAKNLKNRISSIRAASAFETTIRSLGGLLSAYDLSKDRLFLDMAVIIGRRVAGLTNDMGVTPYTFGGGVGGMGCPSLAESGTVQVEMRYLAHVIGEPGLAEKADRFYHTVRQRPSVDGLWPNCWQNGRGKVTFGADGDSFYEYLLKVWVQGGMKDDSLWQMFDAAATGLEKHLLKRGADGLDYLGVLNWGGGQPSPGQHHSEMEHLACFVPGWLALGAKHQPTERQARHMEIAASVANTCHEMYAQQPTGIGPERVKDMKMDLRSTDTREYILRPEAAEGWWYMHELTQNPQYREWGWSAFTSFEKWLRVEHGYASLQDVRSMSRRYIDRMESFFIAETLKYLFLLQDADHTMKLDKYVFNTEAHPLSILSLAPRP